MSRQCNSPVEIVRRLVFLVYIACYVAYLIFCVVALARLGWAEIGVASASLLALLGVRHLGYRWFEFRRLCESFPSGCAMDRIPEKYRTEVEDLVEEFHAPQTDWVRRTDIRHRLVELEGLEPEIIEAYASELRCVLVD